MIVSTTEAQRAAAQVASKQNYQHHKHTPDRIGWTGGKCPVTEYRSKIVELGLSNAIFYPWTRLCLFSTNSADYKKADAGVVEYKAGTTFGQSDIDKGAEIILFGGALTMKEVFACGYDTCTAKVHQRLTGDVEVVGWCYVTDPYRVYRGRYYPKQLRSMDTFPAQDWSE